MIIKMTQTICPDSWHEIISYLLPAGLWNLAMTSKTYMTLVTNYLGPKTIVRKVKYYKKCHYFVISPETIVFRNYDLRFYAILQDACLTILTKSGTLQYRSKKIDHHQIRLYDQRYNKWAITTDSNGRLARYRPAGFTICNNIHNWYYPVNKIRGEQQHEQYIDYRNIRCVTIFLDVIHIDTSYNMYTIPIRYL